MTYDVVLQTGNITLDDESEIKRLKKSMKVTIQQLTIYTSTARNVIELT